MSRFMALCCEETALKEPWECRELIPPPEPEAAASWNSTGWQKVAADRAAGFLQVIASVISEQQARSK